MTTSLPDLDSLPEGADWRIGSLRFRPARGASSVAFIPTGDILSSNANGMIEVWDRKEGVLLRSIGEEGSPIESMALSKDTTRLLAGGSDRVVMWSLADGISAFTRQAKQRLVGLGFTNEDRQIILGQADGTLVVIDSMTGQEVTTLRPHDDNLASFACSPEGDLVALGYRHGTLLVWDAINRIAKWKVRAHSDRFFALAVSSDGSQVVSAGVDDKLVRFWDTQTGVKKMQWDQSQSVYDIVMTSDNKRACLRMEDGTISHRIISTGDVVNTLHGRRNYRRSLAISSDGRFLLSGGSRISLWNLDTGVDITGSDGSPAGIKCMNLNRENDHLLLLEIGDLRSWRFPPGSPSHGFGDGAPMLVQAALSPDGTNVAAISTDEIVRMWDFKTGEAKKSLTGHRHPVESIAFSADGRFLASGEGPQSGGRIVVWDTATWTAYKSIDGTDIGRNSEGLLSNSLEFLESLDVFDSRALSFSPDTKYLASGGSYELTAENTPVIRLWKWQEATCSYDQLIGHIGVVTCLAFSPIEPILASASDEGRVFCWDVESRRVVQRLVGQGSIIKAVAFSQDGRLLASGGRDGVVRVWDLKKGHAIREFVGHEGEVTALQFTRDGSKLLSSSLDSTIFVWNMTP